MLRKIFIFSFLCLPIFSSSLAKKKDHNVFAIYGTDDRYEPFEINEPKIEELSRATVALVPFFKVHNYNDSFLQLDKRPLRRVKNICEEEKFSSQPAAAYCSGVLIDKDLILTAGHCVRLGRLACWGIKIVFDYRLTSSEQDPSLVFRENVYSCSKILFQSTRKGLDYAILRLDRPVPFNRTPVMAEEAHPSVRVSDPLLMIGNPFGLPQKIVNNGVVRAIDKTNFITNLDALNNNSGSPVFSSEMKLVGLLVAGEKDLTPDQTRSCQILNRCQNDDCLGETVQSMEPIVEIIKKVKVQNLLR